MWQSRNYMFLCLSKGLQHQSNCNNKFLYIYVLHPTTVTRLLYYAALSAVWYYFCLRISAYEFSDIHTKYGGTSYTKFVINIVL